LWLDRNRDALVRCGVPSFLYADENRWLGLLEHDGWDAETGWKVEMLTAAEAGRLSDFIAGKYGKERCRGLYRALASVSGEV
jgi:hypothetical protein